MRIHVISKHHLLVIYVITFSISHTKFRKFPRWSYIIYLIEMLIEILITSRTFSQLLRSSLYFIMLQFCPSSVNSYKISEQIWFSFILREDPQLFRASKTSRKFSQILWNKISEKKTKLIWSSLNCKDWRTTRNSDERLQNSLHFCETLRSRTFYIGIPFTWSLFYRFLNFFDVSWT